jgi:transposase
MVGGAEQTLCDQALKPKPKPKPNRVRPCREEKRGGGRRALPDQLERIELTSKETGPTQCGGCGSPLKVIGTDRSGRLDDLPAKVRVLGAGCW